MNALGIALQALWRGTSWRLLLLAMGLGTLPAIFAGAPLGLAVAVPLFHEPRGARWFGELSAETLLEVGRAIGERGLSSLVGGGLLGGLVVALLAAPWLAGATLALVRTSEPLKGRELLRGAGEYWGRLTRLGLVSVLPLAVAGASSAGIVHWADLTIEQAVTETSALRTARLAEAAMGILFFVALLTVDAGRAVLGARPGRRSAFLAWTSGVWLVLRRPLQTGLAGALGLGLGLALAALLSAARARVPSAAVPVSLLLSSLSVAAVGWGRAIRLGALTELALRDAFVRETRAAEKKAKKAAALAEKAAKAVVPPVPDPPAPLPPAS